MLINITNKKKLIKFINLLKLNGFNLDSNLVNYESNSLIGCLAVDGKVVSWYSVNHRESALSLNDNYDEILQKLKIMPKNPITYNYTVTPNSITLFAGAKPYIIHNTHINWEKIKNHIKKSEFEKAIKLFDLSESIKKSSKGKITVKNDIVYYNDKPVNNYVTGRILTLLKEGFNIRPIVNFLEDLYNNNPLVKADPNHYLVNDLYKFLEKNLLPLTEDGGFLAWKRVKNTGYDIHSNTIKYEVNKFVEENFDYVDKNRDNTCSRGLHFASNSYYSQSNFGNGKENKTLLVKVMPSWVCSIPTDYNNSKGRAYKMFVYAEYNDELEKEIKKSVISNTNNKPRRNALGQFIKNN